MGEGWLPGGPAEDQETRPPSRRPTCRSSEAPAGLDACLGRLRRKRPLSWRKPSRPPGAPAPPPSGPLVRTGHQGGSSESARPSDITVPGCFQSPAAPEHRQVAGVAAAAQHPQPCCLGKATEGALGHLPTTAVPRAPGQLLASAGWQGGPCSSAVTAQAPLQQPRDGREPWEGQSRQAEVLGRQAARLRQQLWGGAAS